MRNQSPEMLDYIEGAASLGFNEVVYLGKPCKGSRSCGGGCYGSRISAYSEETQASEETSPLAKMTSDSLN